MKNPTSLLFILSALYLSQGLPAGFLAHALPALLREANVSLEMIGLLKLLALPWMLKWLWAPLVDHRSTPRKWIGLTQAGMALLLFTLAFFDLFSLSNSSLLMFFGVILLLNLLSATQDIVTDGFAVRNLPHKWLGLGNSLQVAGYKIGMLVSGSGLLLVISFIDWQSSLMLISGMIGILGLSAICALPKKGNRNLISTHPPINWSTYKGFFQQKGIGIWLLILVSYKACDSFGSAMIKPMMVDLGLDLPLIASLTFWGTISGLVGAGVGGLLYRFYSPKKTLFFAGLLQAIGIGLFALLSEDSQHSQVLTIVLIEQFADGASTVALFTLMMHFSRKTFAGSDYSLQACIQLLIVGIIGSLSGFAASHLGYPLFFTVASIIGLLMLSPILWLKLPN